MPLLKTFSPGELARASDVNAVLQDIDTRIENHRTSTDHDTRYYTKTQVDSIVNTHKSSSDHDARYYTKTQVDTTISSHNHTGGAQGARIGTTALNDGAVTNIKIADGAVTGAKIASLTITGDKIADGAITEAKIASSAVTNTKLATNAVATANIQDAAVTNIKIANNAVDTSKISDSAITTAKIQDSAVTGAKIASSSITTDKIVDGAVTEAKIATSAVTNAKLAANAVATSNIQDNAVTGAKIAANSVDTAKIVDGSITTSKIQDGAVTGAKIAQGAITPDKLSSGVLGAIAVFSTLPTYNSSTYPVGTLIYVTSTQKYYYSTGTAWAELLDASKLYGTINTNQIADNAISTAKIQNSAITNTKLAANSVATANIQDGAVTNAKIAAGAVTPDKIQTTSLSNISTNLGSVTGSLTGEFKTSSSGARVEINSTDYLKFVRSDGTARTINPNYVPTPHVPVGIIKPPYTGNQLNDGYEVDVLYTKSDATVITICRRLSSVYLAAGEAINFWILDTNKATQAQLQAHSMWNPNDRVLSVPGIFAGLTNIHFAAAEYSMLEFEARFTGYLGVSSQDTLDAIRLTLFNHRTTWYQLYGGKLMVIIYAS